MYGTVPRKCIFTGEMLYAGSILQSYMQEGRESMVFMDFIFQILLDFFFPTTPVEDPEDDAGA